MDQSMLDKRCALDSAIAAKVIPWLMLGLSRSLDDHVQSALREAQGVIDNASRLAHLRGMIRNLLYAFHQDPAPELVESIVAEIVKQVDSAITEEYDEGLEGKPA